jgi:hypothetical protein
MAVLPQVGRGVGRVAGRINAGLGPRPPVPSPGVSLGGAESGARKALRADFRAKMGRFWQSLTLSPGPWTPVQRRATTDDHSSKPWPTIPWPLPPARFFFLSNDEQRRALLQTLAHDTLDPGPPPGSSSCPRRATATTPPNPGPKPWPGSSSCPTTRCWRSCRRPRTPRACSRTSRSASRCGRLPAPMREPAAPPCLGAPGAPSLLALAPHVLAGRHLKGF